MLQIPTTQEETLKARELAAKSVVSRPRLYSMVDLFAGCGGLSLGFENATFTPVFVN